MTPNRVAAILVRWFVVAAFALWVFAPSAPAQPVQAAKPSSITGVYNGTYAGDQGPIKFKLSITQQDNGTFTGSCTIYLTEGSGANGYTCAITGRYIPANRMVQLIRGRWEAPPPSGVVMPGMNGVFDPDGSNGAGQISGTLRARPGPKFEAIRDTAESAKLASAAAEKKEAGQPATPAAPPAGQPTAARPAAASPPSPAPGADAHSPTAINGVYTGGYEVAGVVGVGGNFKAKLSLKSTDDGSLTGLFTFDLPASSGSRSATYKLTGRYVAGTRWPFQFTTVEPLGKPAPATCAVTSLFACFAQGPLVRGRNGMEYSVNLDHISGPVHGEAGVAFAAVRDKAESADLDKVMAAQASAAVAVSTTAPAAPVVRSSVDGVYNGAYTVKQGPTKFKLTLWTQQENRTLEGELININVAGVLTHYLSEGSGTNAYTCELKGLYIPTNGTWPDQIQLVRTKWETKPPRDLLFEAGMQGVFDPHGNNGAGQFSGFMSDPSSSKFQSLRDADESAKVANALLVSKRQPSMAGVFNGTYTREKEPPTKFKLTMMYPSGGGTGGTADLTGVATIYLPTDSGTKAYTYSLIGVDSGYGDFDLTVNDWETIPPKDFKDFKAMGFNGRFVPDMTQNTARIISVQESRPNVVSNSGTKNGASKRPATTDVTSFVPKFEATWDATESADIKGAIAAQKAVGDADLAAALKAHADVLKNAKPKQLASKDLVRKSKAYWDNYRSDFIREVFDGGFASDVDDDPAFQSLFTDYVDLFSKNCAAYLPADHKTITITTTTTTTHPGGATTTSTTSKTVEVDSRFIPKYVEFSGVDPAPGSKQEKEQTAKTIAIAGQIFHAGGPAHGTSFADANALLHLMAAHGIFGGAEMNKFFATEVKATGPSAALRQMGENLLRGATGEPSLQEAGAKIDGAAAETDKDLPPGRFARFIDGANTFYRERAMADPIRYGHSSSHDTAFCETLAAKYRNVMTGEEEYYYANDFEARFFGQIMQPRERCTDPAWARLHPVVEECVVEISQ